MQLSLKPPPLFSAGILLRELRFYGVGVDAISFRLPDTLRDINTRKEEYERNDYYLGELSQVSGLAPMHCGPLPIDTPGHTISISMHT